MSSLFPLYDEVISHMNGEEKTLNQTHCATITKLNSEHINNIYLIILHHYLKSKSNKTEFPYGGRTISNGKGISFRRLSQIPDDLQKIIYRYMILISN